MLDSCPKRQALASICFFKDVDEVSETKVLTYKMININYIFFRNAFLFLYAFGCIYLARHDYISCTTASLTSLNCQTLNSALLVNPIRAKSNLMQILTGRLLWDSTCRGTRKTLSSGRAQTTIHCHGFFLIP